MLGTSSNWTHMQTRNGKSRKSPRRTQQTQQFPSARSSYERYIALAHQSAKGGDPIETESLYQHADHYFRMMKRPLPE